MSDRKYRPEGKQSHVNILWCDEVERYRVSRILPDGREGMFVFHGCLKDALKDAEYFGSFGDVQ